MRPASLATIIIRLFALWMILSSLFALAPLTMILFGGVMSAMAIAGVLVSIFLGVLLYLWSKPLGHFLARGLD